MRLKINSTEARDAMIIPKRSLAIRKVMITTSSPVPNDRIFALGKNERSREAKVDNING
jgi:hypothetical protein